MTPGRNLQTERSAISAVTRFPSMNAVKLTSGLLSVTRSGNVAGLRRASATKPQERSALRARRSWFKYGITLFRADRRVPGRNPPRRKPAGRVAGLGMECRLGGLRLLTCRLPIMGLAAGHVELDPMQQGIRLRRKAAHAGPNGLGGRPCCARRAAARCLSHGRQDSGPPELPCAA